MDKQIIIKDGKEYPAIGPMTYTGYSVYTVMGKASDFKFGDEIIMNDEPLSICRADASCEGDEIGVIALILETKLRQPGSVSSKKAADAAAKVLEEQGVKGAFNIGIHFAIPTGYVVSGPFGSTQRLNGSFEYKYAGDGTPVNSHRPGTIII